MAADLPSQVVWFSSTRRLERGGYPDGGDWVIAPTGSPRARIADADIPLLGLHNRENVLAALLAAEHLGADLEQALDAGASLLSRPPTAWSWSRTSRGYVGSTTRRPPTSTPSGPRCRRCLVPWF